MKPSFSTVAAPEWTLAGVAAVAEALGYSGVELRTFGPGATEFACDPALSDPGKVRAMFQSRGVSIACLATSIRYDAPIRPPVLGRVIGDFERPVRQTRWAVDLAARLECPLVRVFGFETCGDEPRKGLIARVVERLGLACATARNTGVRLAIENAGSFPTATCVSELLDAADDPLLGVAYAPAVAASAGEDPVKAINVLGERLLGLKLRDGRAGVPCAIGWGDLPTEPVVRAAAAAGFDGPIVVEYDRAWMPALPEARPVLAESIKRLRQWMSPAAPIPAAVGA